MATRRLPATRNCRMSNLFLKHNKTTSSTKIDDRVFIIAHCPLTQISAFLTKYSLFIDLVIRQTDRLSEIGIPQERRLLFIVHGGWLATQVIVGCCRTWNVSRDSRSRWCC